MSGDIYPPHPRDDPKQVPRNRLPGRDGGKVGAEAEIDGGVGQRGRRWGSWGGLGTWHDTTSHAHPSHPLSPLPL